MCQHLQHQCLVPKAKEWYEGVKRQTSHGLKTRLLDAVNAFANSDIDEPTYCTIPCGWQGEDVLLLLQNALYGFKQSPAL